MTSVQRFIANNRNAVANATLTASAVKAARAVRQVSTTRAGNGRAVLAGDYIGHADTEIDIEVIAGGTTQRASAPSFAGVGSGALSVVGVDPGATAQTLTFTLADLGTETTHAELAVSGISIRAQASGAAGNSIRISVVPDLTATATAYSLLADWPASQTTQTGEQWAMGGLPLSSKGELDALSPRIRFGDDLDVYRPYREYKDGAWQMGLSPALKRDIKAGTPVWAVTGGYDITVTDGVTPEVYEDVESFHDLIVALAASALVEVVGVAAADRRPGGIAVVDVPLRTTAWVLSQTGKVTLQDVAADAAAPTEIVTVACINADAVGHEVWSVTGSVSGNLGQATTGIPFGGVPLAFTVPAPEAGDLGTGRFSTHFTPAARTEADLGIPSVCVRQFQLGINAQPKTITFTYEERPNDETCDCTTVALIGRITDACLGLASGGTEMALDVEYQTRLSDLYEWRADFYDGGAALGYDADNSALDLDVADSCTKLFADALSEIYSSSSARTIWDTAFTDLQADLAAYIAQTETTPEIGAVLPVVATVCQYVVGNTYYNATRGRRYGLVAATADATPLTGAIQMGRFSWECDPLSESHAGFVTTGADGTISVTIGGVAYVFTFRDLGAYTNTSTPGSGDGLAIAHTPETISRKYVGRMDMARAAAGIVPKSNASGTKAGDGCWRDDPSATHWWVDDEGYYFPAFTNTAYVSSAQSCGSGASADIPLGQPYSTKEFGMFIAASCEERLKIGDKVTIKIDVVDGNKPYAVGDDAVIATVAGGAAYLTGGVTGDDTLSWAVSGSVDGPLDPYELTALEPSYIDAGIEVQINRGGIPFALGDAFTLGIETGQYRWRRDAGAWSAAADIEDGALALADGLTVEFVPGAAPSFLDGDAWTFSARQPYAPANLKTPDAAVWAWSGTGANIVIALGAETDISTLALARYSLPSGATVLIEGGDGSTWPESQAMNVTGAVSVAMLSEAWSVTHLRLTVASATGGSIGWLWAGLPLATAYSAARCRMARSYAIQRGGAINPSSQFLGAGQAGEIAWDADSSPLLQSDLDAVLAMLDHMQRQAEPMILVPHFLHASESGLVRVETDSIDPQEYFELQPDNSAHRIISLDLELRAVHQ